MWCRFRVPNHIRRVSITHVPCSRSWASKIVHHDRLRSVWKCPIPTVAKTIWAVRKMPMRLMHRCVHRRQIEAADIHWAMASPNVIRAKFTIRREQSQRNRRNPRSPNVNLIPKNWSKSRKIGRRISRRRERHDSTAIQIVVTSFDRCPAPHCIRLTSRHSHRRNIRHRFERHRHAVAWSRDRWIQHLCQIPRQVLQCVKYRPRYRPTSNHECHLDHRRHRHRMCQRVQLNSSHRSRRMRQTVNHCQAVRRDRPIAP